jgi:hypothetical protein
MPSRACRLSPPKYAVAIVVVHHTRKGGSEGDPFEKVSGTLGLTGAADTTIVLDRDGNGATLYGRGRTSRRLRARSSSTRVTAAGSSWAKPPRSAAPTRG